MKKLKIKRNPVIYEALYGYIALLTQAVKKNSPDDFSKALVYKNIAKNLCNDCKNEYTNCTCEGSRQLKYDTFGNRIFEPCEECNYNYCLCGYKIRPEKELMKTIFNEAKKELSIDQLDIFLTHLYIASGRTNDLIEKKRLKNFSKALNQHILYEKDRMNKITRILKNPIYANTGNVRRWAHKYIPNSSDHDLVTSYATTFDRELLTAEYILKYSEDIRIYKKVYNLLQKKYKNPGKLKLKWRNIMLEEPHLNFKYGLGETQFIGVI